MNMDRTDLYKTLKREDPHDIPDVEKCRVA